MAVREWTRSNRCRSRLGSFSMWIRSRGGESPQISAKKAPQKRKIKKRSKSVSGSLWTTKTGRERERESGDSSFTLDKFFDVEQISSRPWSEERERERERAESAQKERKEKKKRKRKKKKYLALWSVNDEGREKGKKRGVRIPLLLLNLSST